ncbi:MAG: biopolymer transporter ExbD [Rickettsiales bacterium]|jgi:biopolymer transport protein ExbD|nr:biopolymer transporter ExbD [Rickettsiales bacterium]
MNLDFDDKPIFSEINMTPLVDIMLVLMIIFLITAPILTHSIDIELPKTEAGVSLEKNTKPLNLSISENGDIFNDRNKISLQDLDNILDKIAKEKPDKEIIINADKNSRYEIIAIVLSELKKHKLSNIGLITEIK